MRRAYIAAAIAALGLGLAPCADAARHGAKHRSHHSHRHHRPHLRKPPPGPGVVLDPATGIYRISYYPQPSSNGPDGAGDPAPAQGSKQRKPTLLHASYVPATRIDPKIDSDFSYRADRHELQYSYRIANGGKARQALQQVVIEPVSNISALFASPRNGAAMGAERLAEFEGTASGALLTPANWDGQLAIVPSKGLRIVWRFDASRGKGLAAGRSQSGFGLPADDLPGLVLARVSGNAPDPSYHKLPLSRDLKDRLAYLAAHNYITRPVAVPAIRLPDPYDSIVLIHRIQGQMHGWIRFKLLDPLFAKRLNHHLRAAADELRYGHTQGARYELDAVRLLLALQHPSLQGKEGRARLLSPSAMQIDKLPARVLDFDVNYVEMRMGEGS